MRLRVQESIPLRDAFNRRIGDFAWQSKETHPDGAYFNVYRLNSWSAQLNMRLSGERRLWRRLQREIAPGGLGWKIYFGLRSSY